MTEQVDELYAKFGSLRGGASAPWKDLSLRDLILHRGNLRENMDDAARALEQADLAIASGEADETVAAQRDQLQEAYRNAETMIEALRWYCDQRKQRGETTEEN